MKPAAAQIQLLLLDGDREWVSAENLAYYDLLKDRLKGVSSWPSDIETEVR